jgi:hypothetical protein
MGMEDGNIAESNYPFWFTDKAAEIQLVNNSDHAVTAPCAKYRINTVVVEQFLKILQSFFVCAPKTEIPFADSFACFHLKSPALNLLQRRLKSSMRDKPGW